MPVLNDAEMVYLGGVSAEQVLAGVDQVWSPDGGVTLPEELIIGGADAGVLRVFPELYGTSVEQTIQLDTTEHMRVSKTPTHWVAHTSVVTELHTSADLVTWAKAGTALGVGIDAVAGNDDGTALVGTGTASASCVRSANQGASWSNVSLGATARRGVRFIEGVFVVPCTDRTLRTSATGAAGTWSAASTIGGNSSDQVWDVAYSPTLGLYVAAGREFNNNRACVWTATSLAGPWTLRTPFAASSGSTLTSIVWNGTRFVAVGTNGACAYSTDGTTWSLGETHLFTELRELAWTGTHFIAYASGVIGARTIAISTDGVEWNDAKIDRPSLGTRVSAKPVVAQGSPPTTPPVPAGAAFYVVPASAGTILVSPSLDPWNPTTVTTPDGVDSMTKALWSGREIIVAGAAGRIYRTTDGVAWEDVSTGVTTDFYNVFDVDPKTRRWVGGASNLNPIRRAIDGGDWTSQTAASMWEGGSPSGGLADMHYSADFDLWLYPNVSQRIYWSRTGLSWRSRLITSHSLMTVRSIASKPGLLVAVGYDGFNSRAGFWTAETVTGTWTQRIVGVNATFHKVLWNGSQFVALGVSGSTTFCLTSPDGITWTSRAVGVLTGTVTRLAWDGTQWATVYGTAPDRRIATSADGSGWVNKATGLAAANDIAFRPAA